MKSSWTCSNQKNVFLAGLTSRSLEAINQIFKYMLNSLKNSARRNEKENELEKVSVSMNVSAMIFTNMHPKCNDPCGFSLSCMIGNKQVKNATLDLGASINVIPLSMYEYLDLNDN